MSSPIASPMADHRTCIGLQTPPLPPAIPVHNDLDFSINELVPLIQSILDSEYDVSKHKLAKLSKDERANKTRDLLISMLKRTIPCMIVVDNANFIDKLSCDLLTKVYRMKEVGFHILLRFLLVWFELLVLVLLVRFCLSVQRSCVAWLVAIVSWLVWCDCVACCNNFLCYNMIAGEHIIGDCDK